MIEMYGGDAITRAESRADHLLELGDIEGFEVWKRVIKAMAKLQNNNSPGAPN